MRGKARYKNSGADTKTAKSRHYVAEYRIQVIKTVETGKFNRLGVLPIPSPQVRTCRRKESLGDGSLGHLMVITHETGKFHRTS